MNYKVQKQSKNLKYANPGWSNLWTGLRESPLFSSVSILQATSTSILLRTRCCGWTVDIHQAHLQLISWVKTTDAGETDGSLTKRRQSEVRDMPRAGFQTLQASMVACLRPVAFFTSWHFKVSQKCNARAPNSHWTEERDGLKRKRGS